MLRILIMSFFLAMLGTPAVASAECREGKAGQVIGTVAGGILGGILGGKIDGGKKRGVGTIAGVGVGALIGNALGKALDKCEQKQLSDTTTTTLNSDGSKPQTWTSTSRPGVSGTMVASPAVTAPDGRVCRTVTRVNYVDGQEMQDKPTFCRVPPSTSWGMSGA